MTPDDSAAAKLDALLSSIQRMREDLRDFRTGMRDRLDTETELLGGINQRLDSHTKMLEEILRRVRARNEPPELRRGDPIRKAEPYIRDGKGLKVPAPEHGWVTVQP